VKILQLSLTDQWGEGSGGSRHCHQMTRGVEGSTKMSHVIFSSIFFKLNFTTTVFRSNVFCKMKIVTSHGGGVGWGSEPVSPNDTGGGGSKIGQKSVTYFLNGPLCKIKC